MALDVVKSDRLYAAGELFGVKRLTEVLEETGEKELSEVERRVLAAARRHTQGSPAHDDVPLLAIDIS